MELLSADLRMAQAMFDVLDQAAKVEGVYEVTITFRAEGGDKITVGYGEAAEPAVLHVCDGMDGINESNTAGQKTRITDHSDGSPGADDPR